MPAVVLYYFRRRPANAMRHYTEWLNGLTDDDLLKYQYREVLLIQPTWMMARAVFDRIGGYAERGTDEAPFPEVVKVEARNLQDLDFFHRHLDLGGELRIVPEVLLMYR